MISFLIGSVAVLGGIGLLFKMVPTAAHLLDNLDYIIDNVGVVLNFIISLPNTVITFIQSAFYIVPVYVMIPLLGIVSIAISVLITRLFIQFVKTLPGT